MHFFHLAVFSSSSSSNATSPGHDEILRTGGGIVSSSSSSSSSSSFDEGIINVMMTLPKTMPYTRLSEQLFSFAFVLQVAPLVAELIIPFALRWYARRKDTSGKKKTKKISKGGSRLKDDEEVVVERIALEASLPEYNVFGVLSDEWLFFELTNFFSVYQLDDYLTWTMQVNRVVVNSLKDRQKQFTYI